MVDEWLGRGPWAVIHFNFGLHDIARVNQGEPRVLLADYEKNLRVIVARLRATGAKLVLATTTPVPAVDVRPARRDDDVIAYNLRATKLAGEAHIAIDDLYAVAAPRLAELQQPANVHFTPEGYRALAAPVAAQIRAALLSTAPAKPAR